MLYFIELTEGKDKLLLNANLIETIYEAPKGKSIIALSSSEDTITVNESLEEISKALTRMDLLSKPSNDSTDLEPIHLA